MPLRLSFDESFRGNARNREVLQLGACGRIDLSLKSTLDVTTARVTNLSALRFVLGAA